jgi:hypothetical protein
LHSFLGIEFHYGHIDLGGAFLLRVGLGGAFLLRVGLGGAFSLP